MIPLGARDLLSATEIVGATISEYTCASRTRRAIRRAYCAPKSTTRTVSVVTDSCSSASVTHPHALRPLEVLPFGLQRRGHHDFGLLELLDRLVAAGRHCRLERAEEVHAAVVLVGGAVEDLPQAAPHRGAHP